MLKKFLFAAFISTAIVNHPALAMFEEGKDEKLTISQIKQIRKNNESFSVSRKIGEDSENVLGINRNFKMVVHTYCDGSFSTLLNNLQGNLPITGRWNPNLRRPAEWVGEKLEPSELTGGWEFSYRTSPQKSLFDFWVFSNKQ